MQVLTNPEVIRGAIRQLLSDPKDERIITVAYVGADAASFLAVPSGIIVYCWPQPGGTNPNGIDELLKQGVKVHFVKRLHAKVYWSRTRGALIGSANLTSNALGEQAHQEASVLLPAGAFDMDSFIKVLHPEPDFEAALTRLHEEHIRFLQRNPRLNRSDLPQTPPPSFPEWMTSTGHAKWRFGWYSTLIDDAPSDAVQELEHKAGTREYVTCLSTRYSNDLKVGVFTLSFFVRQDDGKLSKLEWWVPEFRFRTDLKKEKNAPYFWFARRRVPIGARAPFNVHDAHFRWSLQATISELGGLDWLENASMEPKADFLTRLDRNYKISVRN